MTKDFRAVRPAADEHNPYYSRYIDRVPAGDIVDTLSRQIPETIAFLRSIPETKADYAYGDGKWTIRQVIGHMSDAERVFQYRALRFARGDETPVPGFDENSYVDNAPFPRVSLTDLINEFEHIRRSTIYLFNALDEQQLSRRGTANDAGISVRAIAYIIAGHETHHSQILRERYLNN